MADVFSGRPNPTWELPDAVARQLEAACDRLNSAHNEIPERPALGYRGCELKAADGRTWKAFGGIILIASGHQTKTRLDLGRTWERRLLATAPAGRLPPINLYH